MIEHPLIRQERLRLKKSVEKIKLSQQLKEYPDHFLMPIGIQYELTASCNLHCKHCYNRSGDTGVQTLMRPEDWIALSRDIVSNGGVFQCILSGGEPLLLGDHLIEIMDIFHEDNSGFLLISNGLLFNQNWVDKFQKYSFYWIQISIDDSDQQTHDMFRGHQGSWKAAVEAAIRISASGLPLVIAHTVNPQNLVRLPEMVNLAYQLGANTIMCGEVLVSGRAAQDDKLWLNEEQRNILYTQIDMLRNEYAGKMNVQYSLPEGVELLTRKETPNRSIIVRPNGDVRMDCTMPFVIGNVLQTPFAEIWKTKAIHCWENKDVEKYIQNIQPGVKNSDYVNHVTPDRLI